MYWNNWTSSTWTPLIYSHESVENTWSDDETRSRPTPPCKSRNKRGLFNSDIYIYIYGECEFASTIQTELAMNRYIGSTFSIQCVIYPQTQADIEFHTGYPTDLVGCGWCRIGPVSFLQYDILDRLHVLEFDLTRQLCDLIIFVIRNHSSLLWKRSWKFWMIGMHNYIHLISFFVIFPSLSQYKIVEHSSRAKELVRHYHFGYRWWTQKISQSILTPLQWPLNLRKMNIFIYNSNRLSDNNVSHW